jgi:hypothetical protein
LDGVNVPGLDGKGERKIMRARPRVVESLFHELSALTET